MPRDMESTKSIVSESPRDWADKAERREVWANWFRAWDAALPGGVQNWRSHLWFVGASVSIHTASELRDPFHQHLNEEPEVPVDIFEETLEVHEIGASQVPLRRFAASWKWGLSEGTMEWCFAGAR